MNEYRKLEFKSNVFDGYFLWIDVSKYNDKAALIRVVKNHLINFLKTFNLKALEKYANNIEIYCDEIYIDCNDIIKKTTPNTTIYLFENSIRN
jgi:hypothetical protein